MTPRLQEMKCSLRGSLVAHRAVAVECAWLWCWRSWRGQWEAQGFSLSTHDVVGRPGNVGSFQSISFLTAVRPMWYKISTEPTFRGPRLTGLLGLSLWLQRCGTRHPLHHQGPMAGPFKGTSSTTEKTDPSHTDTSSGSGFASPSCQPPPVHETVECSVTVAV